MVTRINIIKSQRLLYFTGFFYCQIIFKCNSFIVGNFKLLLQLWAPDSVSICVLYNLISVMSIAEYFYLITKRISDVIIIIVSYYLKYQQFR